MNKAVLLDSGFLIRLMNPDEPLHPVAMRYFRDLLEYPDFTFIDIRQS